VSPRSLLGDPEFVLLAFGVRFLHLHGSEVLEFGWRQAPWQILERRRAVSAPKSSSLSLFLLVSSALPGAQEGVRGRICLGGIGFGCRSRRDALVVRIGGCGGKLGSWLVVVGFKVLAMEPPRGFWDSASSFLKFLPYFIGLLILGVIKGDMLLKSLASFWYLGFFDGCVCFSLGRALLRNLV
jgi:hypothetical protein